jgi:hypothetical protein
MNYQRLYDMLIEDARTKPKPYTYKERHHILPRCLGGSDDPRATEADWVNPRVLKPEAKHKCHYCSMVTTKSNLTRWHNENCKERP